MFWIVEATHMVCCTATSFFPHTHGPWKASSDQLTEKDETAAHNHSIQVALQRAWGCEVPPVRSLKYPHENLWNKMTRGLDREYWKRAMWTDLSEWTKNGNIFVSYLMITRISLLHHNVENTLWPFSYSINYWCLIFPNNNHHYLKLCLSFIVYFLLSILFLTRC